MTEKKKLDESQIWTIIMTVLPVVILMNAGNELTDESGLRLLYAGIFGGVGGLIGLLADSLTRNKSRILKIVVTVVIIGISGFTIYVLSSNSSDTEILAQQWITQKIGEIEFDSPVELKLQTNEIPESAKWFYSEMNLYSDQGSERITSFLQTKISNDTISIDDAYVGALEGMLQKLNVNMEEVEFEVFGANDEELSSMFSFHLNGESVNGYGFMYLNGNTLESIWLIPLKHGFSKEYIEAFDAGIIPDYK